MLHDDAPAPDPATPASPATPTDVPHPNLAQVCQKLWDGDVSVAEMTEGFEPHLPAVEKLLTDHAAVFTDGVPFLEDSPEYSQLVKSDPAAKVLQDMINRFE